MATLAPATDKRRDPALEVLLSSDLDPIVDMVGWSPERDVYKVASHDGSVRFRRADGGFDVESVERSNPLAAQDATAFSDLDEQRRARHPHRGENSYPNGYQQFAQLFDHPSAPDLCVIHTPSHNWEDQGGHLGEHGSLGVVQARAPFIVAGAGVVPLGLADLGWSTSRRPCSSCSAWPAIGSSRTRTARSSSRWWPSPVEPATSSGSSSTGPTRPSSTTWPPAARRPTWPG
ncbi:MAG: hypothetical protein ACRDYB_09900 [Acidimicrobiales bacterium]